MSTNVDFSFAFFASAATAAAGVEEVASRRAVSPANREDSTTNVAVNDVRSGEYTILFCV
jgi:hypothetical protein